MQPAFQDTVCIWTKLGGEGLLWDVIKQSVISQSSSPLWKPKRTFCQSQGQSSGLYPPGWCCWSFLEGGVWHSWSAGTHDTPTAIVCPILHPEKWSCTFIIKVNKGSFASIINFWWHARMCPKQPIFKQNRQDLAAAFYDTISSRLALKITYFLVRRIPQTMLSRLLLQEEDTCWVWSWCSK